jgi:ATP-dependent helicase/nuclease subunit A
MKKPSDAGHRNTIVTDLDTSLLVEASAGSGKTTSLVNRMLALIASGKSRVETMTAVTFTRKAAAELKGRFQIALEAAIREEKRGEARVRYSDTLLNLDLLFTGTIHAFCARLLRERPVEAGVDPDFTELEEDENILLRSRCWTEYIENLHASGDIILDRLSDLGIDQAQLTRTYTTVSLYPEVEIVREQMDRPDFSRERGLLDGYLKNALSGLPLSVPPDDWDDLQSLLRRVRRLSGNLDLLEDKDLMLVLDALNKAPRIVLKRWNDADCAKRQQAAHQAFRDQVVVPALRRWHRYCHYFIMELIIPAVRYFDSVRHGNSQMNYQDLLMKAAGLLRHNAEVRRYFQKRFTHVLVDEFQDTDPIQAEIILYLAADDVEETSWRSVLVKPGSLFVVGDPKQSIYRFRRADIDTYNEVKEIILRSGGKVVPLTVNFRSTPAVCDWVNLAFAEKFPPVAHRFQPAFEKLEAHSSSGEGGIRCITIEKQFHNNQAAVAGRDAERITSWIASTFEGGFRIVDGDNAERPARPEDFMILLRYKKHVSLYARSLESRGIPYEVAGGAGFGQSEEVHDMLTLLTAVSEPDDTVAIIGMLRGPFFGISDDLLYRFKAGGGQFSYLREEPTSTDEEAGAKIGDAFAVVRQFHRWSKLNPPAAALSQILDRLGIVPYSAARETGETRAGNLLKMVELAQVASKKGNGSFAETIEVIRQYYEELETEEMSVEPGRRRVVRIMNLHKAKGLEAPVVFLADPLKDSDYPPEMHIDRIADSTHGYFPVTASSGNWGGSKVLGLPPTWEEMRSLEERYSRAEEDRLLYVATTRAKQLLVVSRYPSSPDKGAWKDLEPYVAGAEELEEFPVRVIERRSGVLPVEDFQAAQNAIIASLSRSRDVSYAMKTVTAVAEERASETPFSGEGGMGMKWGGMIHKALQMLAEDESVDLGILTDCLLRQSGFSIDRKDEMTILLATVLASGFWKRVKGARQRLCEVPFATQADGEAPGTIAGIIDLAFLEADGWVIADYKSDLVNDNLDRLIAYYSEQVNMYKRFWEEITGARVKEAGIYFTSIDRWAAV